MKPLHRRMIAIVVATAFASPWGAAFGAPQLFKCVEGGRTIYQQQACPVSAQAEPTPGAPRVAARTAAASTDAASAPPARRIKPPSPASSEPATLR